MPSRVKTAPCPELKRGLFSRRETAKVTVSSAEAVEEVARGNEEGDVRKRWDAATIFRRESWYALYFAGGRLEGRILPAPPWMIRRGVIGVGFSLTYSIVGS